MRVHVIIHCCSLLLSFVGDHRGICSNSKDKAEVVVVGVIYRAYGWIRVISSEHLSKDFIMITSIPNSVNKATIVVSTGGLLLKYCIMIKRYMREYSIMYMYLLRKRS